jgi:hypothetical protein
MTETVECPMCEVIVPLRLSRDLETPFGAVTTCVSCHEYLSP